MGHIEGYHDADLHTENGEHRSTPPTTRGRALEQYESRIKTHLDEHRAQGPRWKVMKGEEVLGRAEQWDGETKATLATGVSGGEYTSVINTKNPTGVSDFLSVAFGTEWDGRGGYTIRELDDTGIGKVWAIRAPYKHGTGQKEEPTGIQVVDCWRHSQ